MATQPQKHAPANKPTKQRKPEAKPLTGKAAEKNTLEFASEMQLYAQLCWMKALALSTPEVRALLLAKSGLSRAFESYHPQIEHKPSHDEMLKLWQEARELLTGNTTATSAEIEKDKAERAERNAQASQDCAAFFDRRKNAHAERVKP